MVVSPRGINGAKETVGMGILFYQSKVGLFFGIKPLLEAMAARHGLSSIDTDLKAVQR